MPCKRSDRKVYVVQTTRKLFNAASSWPPTPGDLVLDPTCGSGTTAFVAEQWGRRWITIDTSRVALALARTRLMSARYPYYLLADSTEGRARSRKSPARSNPTRRRIGDIRQGFVYERAPHITLKCIANNAEIDVIWEKWQAKLEPLRETLNAALGKDWEEWEIPREAATLGPRQPQGLRRRPQARTREKAARRSASSTRRWRDYTLETLPERRRRLGSTEAMKLTPMVGGAHRAAEGDRRLHRQGRRCRTALRPPL